MNSRIGQLALPVFLVACASTAQGENKTFVVSFGLWSASDSWFPAGEPDFEDQVNIPATRTCAVVNAGREADTIEINGALIVDENAGIAASSIDIGPTGLIGTEGDVTISDDSTIDGTLEIRATTGRLLIGLDLTITGDGGEILLERGSAIDDSAGTNDLTLAGSCTGDPSRSCSLLVHGSGEIAVTLENNAYVVADNGNGDGSCPGGGDCALRLTENPKSGSGFWIAEDASSGTAGQLYVDAEVTGSATWQLIDDEDAQIVIASCCAVSGDLEVSHGTFTVDDGAAFCTTGGLDFDSSAGTSPRLVIDADQSFTVGAASCSACE